MAEAASAAVAGSSSSQTTATLLERAAAARVAKERELAALPGKDTEAPSASSHAASYHHWRSNDEVKSIQSALLAWYDAEHRKMPWRVHDTLDSCDKAPSQRAYEVWVSEIMLQQTQVATVIPYYERWMAKWPTVNDLASASAEEVNELWSGLGYYSRATRLHAAAKLLVEKFNGTLPKDPAELKKSVPGIGPYTAGAVTSIAYNVKAELVDGNVARVYGRMRAIGGDPKAKATDTLVWKLAADAVSPDRPGAFNQALMECVSISSSFYIVLTERFFQPRSNDLHAAKPKLRCMSPEQPLPRPGRKEGRRLASLEIPFCHRRPDFDAIIVIPF